MEQFLVKQVMVMHLKKGDVVLNYHNDIDNPECNSISKIMRSDGMEDTEITLDNGDVISIDESCSLFVKLPSPEILIPSEEDYNKNEVLRTFQGTLCVGQERIAFKAGWREYESRLKELNKHVNFKIK